MAQYQPGELLFVFFPFASGGRGKDRPALVLLDTGDADVLVARMTGQPPHGPYELAIYDWHGAGLFGPGTVRLHKLATIEKALIHNSIGRLQAGDRQRIAALLNQMFGSW